MPKFLVEYSLTYEHVVRVGVTARGPESAIKKMEAALDAGTVWDDTSIMPLLYDDYEESDNTLSFTVTPVKEFPPPCPSVATLKRHNAAFAMEEILREVVALPLRSKVTEDEMECAVDLVCGRAAEILKTLE
jgi:hypothetical protein